MRRDPLATMPSVAVDGAPTTSPSMTVVDLVSFQGGSATIVPRCGFARGEQRAGSTLRERCGSDARRLTGPPTLRRLLRHEVWGGAAPDDNVLTVYTRTVGSDGRLGRVRRVGKVEKRPRRPTTTWQWWPLRGPRWLWCGRGSFPGERRPSG